MSELKEVRKSLEVGFPNQELPQKYAGLRGKAWRVIDGVDEFPFEDAQFEVVVMDEASITLRRIKEANRVLLPNGLLYFTVKERTRKQAGFTLPDVYTAVRDGFNIIEVHRPAWWLFGMKGQTISIVARKKTWKTYQGLTRYEAIPFSPFRSHA